MNRTLPIALGLLALTLALPAQQALVLQDGAQGGPNARTHGAVIHPDGTTSKGPSFDLGDGRGLLAFPSLVGPGGDRLPPGGLVSSATLELWVEALPSGPAMLELAPITDWTQSGPWHEPEGAHARATGVGVSWASRDARSGVSWIQPGGDAWTGAPFVRLASITSAGAWVSIDVTDTINAWAQGLSNQGFRMSVTPGSDLRLASDDHPDATLRPKLTIAWNGRISPFNHVAALEDRQLTVTAGTSAFVAMPLTDADGQRLTWVTREAPSDGQLQGSGWFTYTPRPGFVGQDRFSVFARDGFAVTALATITVDVQANPGVEAASSVVSGTSVTVSTFPTQQTLTEDDFLVIEEGTSAAFLDTDLMGGSLNLPFGATILNAELTLTLTGSTPGGVVLDCAALADPAGLGRFVEATSPQTATQAGVSWLWRDARAGQEVPWLVPGGETFASTTDSQTPATYAAGETVRFDVTSAIQRRLLAEAGSGWRITARGLGSATFASERHANLAWRPRLSISWRRPGSLGTPQPVALAGADRTVAPGETVVLDGSASYVTNGETPSMQWGVASGPLASPRTSPEGRASFVAPNVVVPTTIRLFLVAAAHGLSDTDEITIRIDPALATSNRAPVAEAGPDQVVREGDFVLLDAGASFDPEGGPLSYQWQQVAGPSVFITPVSRTARAFIVAPIVLGQPVRLHFQVVVDDGFHADHDHVMIEIHPSSNRPPVVVTGPDQTVTSGTWVGLDALRSTDPDPRAQLTFTWVQMAGTPVTLHRHDTPRPYFEAPQVAASEDVVVDVQVSDGLRTSTSSVRITVHPTAPVFRGGAQSLAPYADAISLEEAQHLMRRAGFGASPQNIAAVMAQGLTATVDELLSPVPEPGIDLAAYGFLPAPVGQDRYPETEGNQAARWMLTYQSESAHRNQLREKLAYFWHDLFAASGRVTDDRERHWTLEYLDAFRQDPTPNYRDFCIRITRNSLMLDWLDGHDNRAGAANENYAREFWELFTLGEVHPITGVPSYTEFDVQEASRALTGWRRYDPSNIAGNSYYSRFDSSRHDSGLKTVFGYTGPWDDVDLVDITLSRPEAGEFICYQLFRFFVHEQPTLATVQVLANELRQANWEIASVVRTILRSEAMFSSMARQSHVKTATEFLVGFQRTTGLRIPLDTFTDHLVRLGHAMGDPPSVKGWEEGLFNLGAAAVSARSQAINDFAYSSYLPLASHLDQFVPPADLRTSTALVERVHRLLGVRPLSAAQMHHLIGYLDSEPLGPGLTTRQWFDGDDPTVVDRKLRSLLWLVAIANAEYQLN